MTKCCYKGGPLVLPEEGANVCGDVFVFEMDGALMTEGVDDPHEGPFGIILEPRISTCRTL